MLECLVVAGKLNDLVLILHGKHVFIFNAIKLLWKYTDLFTTVNKKEILFVNILIPVQKLDFTKSTAPVGSVISYCHLVLPSFFQIFGCVCCICMNI